MRRFLRIVPVLAVFGLLAGLAPDGAGAATARTIVRTQQACWPTCGTVGPQGAVTEAQSFPVVAPGKGTAVVSFEGTIYCGNNDASTRGISVLTQITDSEVDPEKGGPGALEFLATLGPRNGQTTSSSFNLASTRVFKVQRKGLQTYRFRLFTEIMDPGVGCGIRGGAFTVTFHPRGRK